MFWAAVLPAVVVVVAEVPWLTCDDALAAAPAVDLAGGDVWRPLAAQLVVLAVVPACLS